MGAGASIGDVVADRYRLDRELGHGGMATVFAAHDNKLDRTVAIKILHGDFARQPPFRTRFRQEAQAAARLNHPNVVRVFDAGEVPDPREPDAVWPFLVMEYLDGKTLEDVLRAQPPSVADALEIQTQLLAALDYSHQAGIVHRDIKPANIMVTSNGAVKVMDFGIAQSIEDGRDAAARTTSILGTAAYFSPEQARGDEVDARSDVYSAGIVLFEMLTGQVPFRDASPVRVAYQHISEPAPAPSSLNAQVPPAIDEVVSVALAKNLAERFQTAADFSSAIEAAQRGESPEAFAPDPGALFLDQFSVTELSVDELALRQLAEAEPVVRSAKRPPVMWIWAGGTLILAMVIGVLFWAVALAPSGGLPSTEREIPSLANMSELEATAALKKLDLTPMVVQITDDKIAAGKVVRSNPEAGEIVTEGTSVSVYVSKGRAAVAVPEVRNLTLDQAKAALVAAGFVPGAENKVDSPSAPEGVVVGTDPVGGTPLAPGSVINLSISNGKITVPDVTGKPLSEASALLAGDTLRMVVEPVGDRGCKTQPNNPVNQQSITPGDAPQGSSIKLYFCAG